MNFSNKNTDIFLSEWMAGKISDDELKQFVGQSEFEAYQKLKQSIDTLKLADPDMERNYAAIKAKKSQKRTVSAKVVNLYQYAAVPAVLIIMVGLYQLFVFSNSVSTGYGESMSFDPGDNSKVTLNAQSEASYPSLFTCNRTLRLKGEAYFEVQKGSTFTVKTANGDVVVLGTKFNVDVQPDYFQVVCFQGKVRVCTGTSEVILTKGQGIRYYHGKPEKIDETAPGPLWLQGESSFHNVPFGNVISKLKDQYNCNIDFPRSLKDARFTGTFTNRNLETALKSVSIPMRLRVTSAGKQKIILSE